MQSVCRPKIRFRIKDLLNSRSSGPIVKGTTTGCQVCYSNELRAIYGLHDSDI